jgi:sugar phosphate isomerase/epimerase
MVLTPENWPIAASMLPFAASTPDSEWNAATEAEWARAFTAVRRAGFDDVDLTDTWLPFGDLDAAHRSGLAAVLERVGLRAQSLSVIRRSVTDAEHGDAHLAYSHRAIDLAAELGIGVVSVGLHRPLTAEQKERLWFWTVPGHRDPINDPDDWKLAVSRFRELGQHADEVGVLLSLEMYEHTYLGSSSSSVRLIEDIGLDNVGLNPDIGNLIRLHEPVEDWRELVAKTMPYTNYWHVKNYVRDENPTTGLISAMPSYMESGLINYREALEVAVRNGFQGVICTEHYGGDGLSMTAANRDYLRRVLPVDYELGQSRVRQQFQSVEVP